MDERLLLAIYGGDSSCPTTSVMIALTILGNGLTALALFPLLALRRTRTFALTLGGVILGQAILIAVLKAAGGRVRPWIVLNLHSIVRLPTDYSFPSGHASGSFSVATFAAVLLFARARRRRTARPDQGAGGARLELRALLASVALFALAAAIATSRVYLGAHWPTDVAAGAVLGTVIGGVGGRIYLRITARADGAGREAAGRTL